MDKIELLNPYESYRNGQKESIIKTLESVHDGNKIIELNSPTATGKSGILTVICRALIEEDEFENAIYTSPQKILISQLANDAHLKIPALLGRGNYFCPKVKGNSAINCPVPSRLRRKTCKDCPYITAKDVFLYAPLKCTTLDKILTDKSIPIPDILVVDESQNLEPKLINATEIEIPNTVDLKNAVESVGLWVRNIEMEKLKVETRLEKAFKKINFGTDESPLISYIDSYDAGKDTKELERIERILKKARGVQTALSQDLDSFIITKDRMFRHMGGRQQFQDMIMNTRLIILASGTPCTQMLTDGYQTVKAPHPIAVDRRMVYFMPVGKMNYKERIYTIPKMAKVIAELHNKYKKHTIIHCHSYPIADSLGHMIYDEGVRCMWVEKKEREESIENWRKEDDVCLMSVACEEGLDLAGPDYPLNIVAKIPFGVITDEWFKKRKKLDDASPKEQRWENISVAIAIQQAAGRCTRGPNDFSETYILDESFNWFYNNNFSLFEKWFIDALRRKKAPT